MVGRLLVRSLTAPEQPRKVMDAQRGWIARILVEKRMSIVPDADLISEICAVFESTDEPAAK